MKKILLLALSATSVFTLAGCFGGDSEPTEKPDETPGETPTDEVSISLENVSAVTGTDTAEIDIKADIKEELTDAKVHYIVTDTNATKPSASEVKAGVEYLGNEVHEKGSVTGDLDETITLVESQEYTVYFVGSVGDEFSAVEDADALAKADLDKRPELISDLCVTEGDQPNETENGEYIICNEEDLAAIGDVHPTKTNEEGEALSYSSSANYILGADIDFTAWIAAGNDWRATNLGGCRVSDATDDTSKFDYTECENSEGQSFKGDFNGNGHTISNLEIKGTIMAGAKDGSNPAEVNKTSKDGGVAMFALIGDSSGAKGLVRNLTIENFDIETAEQSSGALIGRMRGEGIENINVVNSSLVTTASDSRAGLVAGRIDSIDGVATYARNIFIDKDSSIVGMKSTGGAFGNASVPNNVMEEYVRTYSDIVSYATVTGTENVGGIIGGVWSANVERVVSYADVTGEKNVGSVIGAFSVAGSKCHNSGTDNACQTYVKDIYALGGSVNTLVSEGSLQGGVVIGSLTSDVRVTASDIYTIDSLQLEEINGTGTVSPVTGTDSDNTSKNGMKIDLATAVSDLNTKFDTEFVFKIENDKIVLNSFFK